MKKSKVVLVIALAVILTIALMDVPTFSTWFSRPHSEDGAQMVLQTQNQYTAYNGIGCTFSTNISLDGDPDNYTTALSSYSGSNIAAQQRKYYCTTITNGSGQDQNVSLFIKKLSIPNDSTLAVGINGPTRNYRDFSELVRSSFTTTNNTMRIYFEKNNNVNEWNGTDFYICWKAGGDAINSTGSNGTYYKLEWVGDPGHPNQYYADIPSNATQCFFAIANWGTADNGSPKWWQRTQLMTNIQGDGVTPLTSAVYKVQNYADGGNCHADHYSAATASIKEYYTSISVPRGSSNVSAMLTSGTQYAGGQIKFYSGDESVFEVDETTGVITGVAVGEAKLYTKVINSAAYWDSTQVETTIKVTESSDFEFTNVPLVRNIQIPGSPGADPENPANVVKVYWYVMNNSTSGALSYTIDTIYLSV